MDGTGSDDGRVAMDGVVVVSATEAEAGVVALFSMREWVEKIPKIVIVITEGFRRSETTNGCSNWRKEPEPTEGNREQVSELAEGNRKQEPE